MELELKAKIKATNEDESVIIALDTEDIKELTRQIAESYLTDKLQKINEQQESK